MIKNTALFLLSLAILGGCNSLEGAFVERKGVNASIEGIIKAFDRHGGGVRGRSANGREIVSRYHPPSGDSYADATMSPSRAFARLRILGDRRPYTLQVQYVVEERTDSGDYRITGYDQAKAKTILKGIHEFLVRRPDKDNFIDDFRPF